MPGGREIPACKRIEEQSRLRVGWKAVGHIELEDTTHGVTVRLDAGHITDMRTGRLALGLVHRYALHSVRSDTAWPRCTHLH